MKAHIRVGAVALAFVCTVSGVAASAGDTVAAQYKASGGAINWVPAELVPPVDTFCLCFQSVHDSDFIHEIFSWALGDRYHDLLDMLLPPDVDFNGDSWLDRSARPIRFGIYGNGMPDCMAELMLVERILKDPTFSLPNGLTYQKVKDAWDQNERQFARDVGDYWWRQGPLLAAANGLPQIMKGLMILGDGTAGFPASDFYVSSGSVGHIQVGMLLAAGGVDNPVIDPSNYGRLPQYFSKFGDADGDGCSNWEEYLACGEDPFAYVKNALDPTIHPAACAGSEGEGEGEGEGERPPALTVTPASVDFGPVTTVRSLLLSNVGGGVLNWTVAPGTSDWLSVPETSGQVTWNSAASVILYVQRKGLALGTYQYTVLIRSNGGNAYIPVTMTAPEPGPDFTLSTDSLDFGTTITARAFNVMNTGGGLLTWQLTEDLPAWLRAPLVSGQTAGGTAMPVALSVVRQGLPPGKYDHTVSISTDAGIGSVTVAMTVPPPFPLIGVTPDTLDFVVGTTARSFAIGNLGGGILTWNITDDLPAWLQVPVDSGDTVSGNSAAIDVQIARIGLAPGTYQHTITVTSNGGSAGVLVTMAVGEGEEGPGFRAVPDRVNLGAWAGTGWKINILDPEGATLLWNAGLVSGQEWLSVAPSQHLGDGFVTLAYEANPLTKPRSAIVHVQPESTAWNPIDIVVTQAASRGGEGEGEPEPDGPTAAFTADPVAPTISPIAPATVQFTDLSDEGSYPITSWQWTFGDGLGSHKRNPSHTYASPGAYTVTLKVITAAGTNTETKTDYIVVTTANDNDHPGGGCVGGSLAAPAPRGPFPGSGGDALVMISTVILLLFAGRRLTLRADARHIP